MILVWLGMKIYGLSYVLIKMDIVEYKSERFYEYFMGLA